MKLQSILHFLSCYKKDDCLNDGLVSCCHCDSTLPTLISTQASSAEYCWLTLTWVTQKNSSWFNVLGYQCCYQCWCNAKILFPFSICSVRTNVIATNDISVPSQKTVVYPHGTAVHFCLPSNCLHFRGWSESICVLQVTGPCVWWRSAWCETMGVKMSSESSSHYAVSVMADIKLDV